jgi:integrase
MPINAITRESIEKWVAWQAEQETVQSKRARLRAKRAGEPEPAKVCFSAKSIANAHGILSSVLFRAVKAGKIDVNPARGVKLPKKEVDREPDIFTDAEFSRFWALLPDHYKAPAQFMLATQMRPGEALALQVRDIDLTARTARVRRAWKQGVGSEMVIGPTKTARSRRTVLFSDVVAKTLKPLVENRDPEDWLFQRDDKPLNQNTFQQNWKRTLKAAGIAKKLTPRSSRHTGASWLLMQGVPAQIVQHRLGHESLQTTSKVYAHLLDDMQTVAVTALDHYNGIGGAAAQVDATPIAEPAQIEAAPHPGPEDIEASLVSIKKLRDLDVLTEAEFTAKKAELLGRL